jgi:hypothetical protein
MCDNKDKKDNCCNFEYLKPLSIESLFEVDNCTKYADTLEKAKRVRNAFFAAKTSVFNFINECDIIADTLQSDLSDNDIELNNIRDQYYTVLNNLTSALYTSLKQTYNNRQLINVDLAKVDDSDGGSSGSKEQAARAQKSSDLSFSHPYGSGLTTLCYIPGVTIQLNKEDRMLKLKLSQPNLHSGYNRHGQYKKDKDIVTTLVLAPSVNCTASWVNWQESTDEINNFNHCNDFGETRPNSGATTVFSNVDIAMDFFEEYQNYQDNYILDDDTSYGNQVLEIMNYFDRVIRTMEGAHKFVVQLSKINNAAVCDDCDDCDDPNLRNINC